MTTTTHSPAAIAPAAAKLPLRRRILFRTGIVLTTVTGLANTVNGGSGLLGLQGGGAQYAAIGWLLFGIGFPTLVLVGFAWVPKQWALWAVIVLRALEALTMWVPLGPGDWYHEPARRGFYLVLVAASVLVCTLMSFGLRRRPGIGAGADAPARA